MTTRMDMEVTANTDDADMAVSSLLNITSVIRVCGSSSTYSMAVLITVMDPLAGLVPRGKVGL